MFNRDLKSRGFIRLPFSGYGWNATCTPANSGSEQPLQGHGLGLLTLYQTNADSWDQTKGLLLRTETF